MGLLYLTVPFGPHQQTRFCSNAKMADQEFGHTFLFLFFRQNQNKWVFSPFIISDHLSYFDTQKPSFSLLFMMV